MVGGYAPRGKTLNVTRASRPCLLRKNYQRRLAIEFP
jgi:hypothetical protein